MKIFFQIIAALSLLVTFIMFFMIMFFLGGLKNLEVLQKGVMFSCISGIPGIISAIIANSIKEE